MKKDISIRQDVELLVNTFYDKVKVNPVIGYIFNDIAKVDWESHLPRMYSFWASILIGEQSFSGNPMQKHVQLSRIAPMTEAEFGEWLNVFMQTTDELFAGDKANEAKVRAANIARLMLHKINAARSNPNDVSLG
jgi:hemoglobin